MTDFFPKDGEEFATATGSAISGDIIWVPVGGLRLLGTLTIRVGVRIRGAG